MPALSAIHRPARLASLAILAIAALAACTAASTLPPATPAAASPGAVASQSPDAVATSPDDASPAAASGSPAPKGGRSYGGGATDTPAPKPKTTPQPKPAVKTVTVRAASTGLGKVLVGSNGMTLYIRTSDGMNASGCNGSCAANWPPFTVKSGTKAVAGSGVHGAFGTITRSDGSHQVTYKGKPLYYFVGDYYTGDTTGQGVGGIWYVAKA